MMTESIALPESREMRIASFLPAATEMIYALGLGDQLVGRSHECDYPPEAKEKPVVVRCAMDLEKLGLAEIDVAVSDRAHKGESVYAVDEAVLRKVAPHLIVTQDLCHVCAPSGNEITRALASLTPKPEILWQTPHSFSDVLDAVIGLGIKTNCEAKARQIAKDAQAKVDSVALKTSGLKNRPRVFFMEWVDPVYCGGHWIPSMISWAGGRDDLAVSGSDSVRMAWDDVLKWDPEVLVVAPCGFYTDQAYEQIEYLRQRPGWDSLTAVRNRNVFAVNANAYFAKPGLRLAEGVELLAHLIHPKMFSWLGPKDAFRVA
jgi:iron complex transport system substrate-binding protein